MAEKTTETALAQVSTTALADQDYGFDVQRVLRMRQAVEEIIEKVLNEGEHYGVIPGTTQEGKKPKKSLLQPGAEVLCQVFRLRPEFHEMAVIERDDFIYYKIKCKLYNSVTGECVGEALGSANTREEKYTGQTAAKLCPECKRPFIFRSKKRPGDTSTIEPGWFCWEKKGGCGIQFAYEDKKLLDQTGAISTDKVWNLHHTILSQAQKRPYVRAVRNATGTSNIFTDEDVPPDHEEHGGQTGTTHARTSGTKPSAGPKILATDVMKLNEALRASELLPANLDQLPKAEQDTATRKLWLDWVNDMLADAGKPKVGTMMEIPQDQVAALIQAAKDKKLPKEW